MRTLILLRHATAVDHHPEGDQARGLTEQGIAEAAEVGAQLKDRGVQLALVSNAVRARETFEHLALDARAEYMAALYTGGTDEMRQRIAEVDDEVQVLLVVGHAPTIPALASQLSYQSDRRESDQIGCWFPTGSLVEFQLEGSWADLEDPDAAAQLSRITRR